VSEIRGKTVLVTGAASGIGRETALAFARESAVLLLADIDAGGMAEVRQEVERIGAACRTYVADVSSAESVSEMAKSITSEFGGLDVLVNNAGVFVWGDFIDTTIEDWQWLMGVNLWGPIHTMRAFLPGMIERGGGHLVNVASGGGLVTLPALSGYCATKFALVGLSEALWQEVRDRGISVTTVCPGSTRTPIINNIRVRGLDRDKLTRVIFPVANRYPADRVGAAIVDAVKRDRAFVVLSANIKFMWWVKRLSPSLHRVMIRPFARLFYSRMRRAPR
jgi:NAD(P)-dependent dehydrogenase (short-subunit alcohol dehydrogenase family)